MKQASGTDSNARQGPRDKLRGVFGRGEERTAGYREGRFRTEMSTPLRSEVIALYKQVIGIKRVK